MVDQIDIMKIKTGDLVEVDADKGLVKILERRH
jgi:DNA helicase TIP49 (TBP-interacting protein)